MWEKQRNVETSRSMPSFSLSPKGTRDRASGHHVLHSCHLLAKSSAVPLGTPQLSELSIVRLSCWVLLSPCKSNSGLGAPNCGEEERGESLKLSQTRYPTLTSTHTHTKQRRSQAIFQSSLGSCQLHHVIWILLTSTYTPWDKRIT